MAPSPRRDAPTVTGTGTAPTARARHPYRWVMLAAVWGVYAAFGLVTGSLAPVIEPILDDIGIGRGAMGAVLGAWQLVYLGAAIPAGRVIDRLGLRTSLGVAAAVITLSAGLRAVAWDLPTLFLAVAVFGLGGPLVSIGAPKLISVWFDEHDRRTAVGIYTHGPGRGHHGGLRPRPTRCGCPSPGRGGGAVGVFAALAALAGVAWIVAATRSPFPEGVADADDEGQGPRRGHHGPAAHRRGARGAGAGRRFVPVQPRRGQLAGGDPARRGPVRLHRRRVGGRHHGGGPGGQRGRAPGRHAPPPAARCWPGCTCSGALGLVAVVAAGSGLLGPALVAVGPGPGRSHAGGHAGAHGRPRRGPGQHGRRRRPLLHGRGDRRGAGAPCSPGVLAEAAGGFGLPVAVLASAALAMAVLASAALAMAVLATRLPRPPAAVTA